MSYAPNRDWSVWNRVSANHRTTAAVDMTARYLEMIALIHELRERLRTGANSRADQIAAKVEQRSCYRGLAINEQVKFGYAQECTD